MANKSEFEILVEMDWKPILYATIFCFVIALISSSLIFWIFTVLGSLVTLLSFLNSVLKNKIFKNIMSIEDIKKLSWLEFEFLIESFYKNQGYSVYHSGGENVADGGIDVVAEKNGEKIVIQCKHWKAYKVDVKVIREMYGIMVSENASRAVIICSGDFTQPAIDFATGKPLELINGNKLVDMIRAVKEKQAEKADLKNKTYNKSYQKKSVLILDDKDISNKNKYTDDDFMPPELRDKKINNTSKTADPPVCPFCHKPMVLRVATRGLHHGEKFWGCSNYPKCRHLEKFKQ